MKKSLFFITAIFFSLILSSCFLLPQNESEKKILTIGFSYSGRNSEPYLSNQTSIREAFSDASKYRIVEFNSNCEIKEQVNNIYSFVQRKVDFIIVDPVNEHGLKYAIDNCFLHNIPVIVCGNSVATELDHENRVVYEVRPDFYREAVLATKCLELYEQGKVDVEILVLNDFADTTSARERNLAIGEAVEKNEGWKIISKRETNGEYIMAKSLMEEVYAECPGLDVVFVESENDYQGVIDVLFKHGKMPGEDVYIFAFEDTDNLRRMIMSGVLNYTVVKNQDVGQEISYVINRIKKGKSYKKTNLADAQGLYSNKSIEEKIVSREGNILYKIFE